jgi:hypothetical protein
MRDPRLQTVFSGKNEIGPHHVLQSLDSFVIRHHAAEESAVIMAQHVVSAELMADRFVEVFAFQCAIQLKVAHSRENNRFLFFGWRAVESWLLRYRGRRKAWRKTHRENQGPEPIDYIHFVMFQVLVTCSNASFPLAVSRFDDWELVSI